MKGLFILLAFAFVLFASCNSYPQSVSVKTTYTTPAEVDSSYLVMWKGTDITQNQLFEDGNWYDLDKTGLLIYKIPLGTSVSFTSTHVTDGRKFKLAIVNFGNSEGITLPSKLTVSTFYTLPVEVQKATIINVEIF
jgi:hypothetical protein